MDLTCPEGLGSRNGPYNHVVSRVAVLFNKIFRLAHEAGFLPI